MKRKITLAGTKVETLVDFNGLSFSIPAKLTQGLGDFVYAYG
jgi:hypothetical protein